MTKMQFLIKRQCHVCKKKYADKWSLPHFGILDPPTISNIPTDTISFHNYVLTWLSTAVLAFVKTYNVTKKLSKVCIYLGGGEGWSVVPQVNHFKTKNLWILGHYLKKVPISRTEIYFEDHGALVWDPLTIDLHTAGSKGLIVSRESHLLLIWVPLPPGSPIPLWSGAPSSSWGPMGSKASRWISI